ncbi:[FeFe] hydrogenase H-cluster radical SAM maturase HydE [Geotoga petraea]|jgi:biotin synthase|uniref:Biotin synthase n=1 Tax=Geotoga petraea TaxID=28234 RepID=A0A1G6K4N3_9BACT|nr:[FeFe] hydrogenase H-cluster radical SAM maturase HydE [Geotoga petraea]TGG88421.1 [FeFe] hydrogenase H-cluster radical SAM maturase HydE [Geotoga petraea]SDC25924.1 biotin synthase [Geotoga petraea]
MFESIYNKLNTKGKKLLDYFTENKTLNKEFILYILGLEKDDPQRNLLYKASSIVKENFTANYVSIKGLIEFSNYCSKNCYYCGIRRDNKTLKRYRMTEEDILEAVEKVKKLGLDTIILQSGEDYFYDDDKIIALIKKIKKLTKLPISISIGERDFESYFKYKKAGAIRTLLKHETVNRELFEKVNPDKKYEKRLGLLKYANSIGYVTGSGFIIGLPGQTNSDIADDLLFIRDEKVIMIGIGPLIASKNTPYENMENGSITKTLNACCAARFVVPNSQMPVTTALGTLDIKTHYDALEYFCNVVMVNITPDKFRKNYNIYDNKAKIDFFETIDELEKREIKICPITTKALGR